MCQQTSILFLVIVASTWKTIGSYYRQKEQWDTCPYPVGFWYMIVALCFNLSLILSFVTHSMVPFRSLGCGLTIATVPALIQCFLLVWNVIGTVWVVLTLYSDADCVKVR